MVDDERPPWLASIRAQNPELAADLQTLLDEHSALVQEGFLEHGPDPLLRPLAGQTVGAYRLLSAIGQGGMSSVWLAERSDGRFEGRAAVKFLNLALVGPGEQRFKRESWPASPIRTSRTSSTPALRRTGSPISSWNT